MSQGLILARNARLSSHRAKYSISVNFVYAVLFLGVTPYQALSEWYNTHGRRGTYADVPVESPRCNPTCCSKYCSRCSRASEMLVVSGKRHTHDVETQKLKTEIVQSPTTITSG